MRIPIVFRMLLVIFIVTMLVLTPRYINKSQIEELQLEVELLNLEMKTLESEKENLVSDKETLLNELGHQRAVNLELVKFNRKLTDKVNLLEEQVDELRTIPAVVTYYAPTDPTSIEGFDYLGDPKVTSTGTRVRQGVAAADPDRLPYGTKFEIDGEEYIVEDTGSAMRNSDIIRVDLVVASRSEAFRLGRHEAELKILVD